MISYDYYKVFYYVCKYRNFTKAANVLSTSQSSISHTMLNLEHQLGCRLFTRSNRGIRLTVEGEKLYEYVSIACEQLLKGESELTSTVNLEEGIIYIGTTETALHCFLFEALDGFHLKHPHVKFKISNFTTTEAINALKNGLVDFAVTATPFELYPHMKSARLKSFRDILIAGSGFNDLRGKTLKLSETCSYPLISFTSGTKSRDFMDDVFRSYNLTLSPAMESATSDLILPMVKHNLGLGFIPENIAFEAMDKGDIFKINLQEELPERYVTLIYDTQYPHSIASMEFQKFLLNLAGNM